MPAVATPIVITESLVARMLAKVDRAAGPEDMDACWNWIPGVTKSGYGNISITVAPNVYRKVYAHRLMYEYASGAAVPDGAIVCHRCDNPRCVRPSHMFLGTQADNMADMTAKGRRRSGITLAMRTHCNHGHEFTAENTRTRSNGSRRCWECERKHWRARVRPSRARVH